MAVDKRKIAKNFLYVVILAICIIIIHELEYDYPTGQSSFPPELDKYTEKPTDRNLEIESKYRAEILNVFSQPDTDHSRLVYQTEFESDLKFEPKPTQIDLEIPMGLNDETEIEAENVDHVDREKPRVLIMTHHRSGSSFTGELFNQHPDVFYMYDLGIKMKSIFRQNNY